MLKLLLLVTAITAAFVLLILVANARDPYGGVLVDPDHLA